MIKGIVVEGADCSGKTTLIQTLKGPLSHCGWDIATVGHKEESQFDRYMKIYTNAHKVIFDRAHFSEIVYDALWRGGNALSQWEQSFLNSYVFENFLVVFVHAPGTLLKERYRARKYGQTINTDELEFVQSHFASLLSHPNVLHYNSSSSEALDSFVKKVLNILQSQGLCNEVVKKYALPAENKKKFILLEGPNGSGKSTLSKLLKISMVGWGVKTLDYKPVEHFQRYLHEYTNNPEMIFDRGHFSEIIYGNIFREGKHFSPFQIQLLNDYVAHRGIVILCNPPVEVLVHRVARAEYPKHIHEMRLGNLKESFNTLLSQANIPFYSLDTSNKESVNEFVEEVSNMFMTKSYLEMGWGKPQEGAL